MSKTLNLYEGKADMPDDVSENQALPELISTADPGSFARSTVVDRQPHIIKQIREDGEFDARGIERLESLIDEMKNGTVENPISIWNVDPMSFHEDELRRWEKAVGAYAGRSWLDIPWYFAESFFYFKLLCAIGYYDAESSSFMIDPFQVQKTRELSAGGGVVQTAMQLSAVLEKTRSGELSAEEGYYDFVMASLWGNRIDLSNAAVTDSSRVDFLNSDTHELVVDNAEKLCRELHSADNVDIILDNSGPELMSDLFLALYFLSLDPGRCVQLFVKNAPFYVSDTM
ncbi:MAG: DUF89 family protein, partial [Spirochaetales bacterium]|nr:DUF89 family protein [Spirochaetales bacterium]